MRETKAPSSLSSSSSAEYSTSTKLFAFLFSVYFLSLLISILLGFDCGKYTESFWDDNFVVDGKRRILGGDATTGNINLSANNKGGVFGRDSDEQEEEEKSDSKKDEKWC